MYVVGTAGSVLIREVSFIQSVLYREVPLYAYSHNMHSTIVERVAFGRSNTQISHFFIQCNVLIITSFIVCLVKPVAGATLHWWTKWLSGVLDCAKTSFYNQLSVLSGRCIAAHPWPVLRVIGDEGSRLWLIVCSWNSAIECRSQVWAQSLVLFPLSSYTYFWAVDFPTILTVSINFHNTLLIFWS